MAKLLTKLVAAFFGLAVLLLASAPTTMSQSTDDPDLETGLYVIYDSSNSMWGELADGTRKYEAARQAITDFLTSDFNDQSLALRVYGAQNVDDCQDSHLVVPFQRSQIAAPLIDVAVSSSRPTGRTPLHLSLMQALDDFGDRPGRILLISDGVESCGADPCALLQQWQDSNVAIDVHIVGFGLRSQERPALLCMANAAGTPFIEAGSAAELEAALQTASTVDGDQNSEFTPDASPTSFESAPPPRFLLHLVNHAGDRLRGGGYATLVDDDGSQIEFSEVLEIATHYRNPVLPGRVQIDAGVRTLNGNTYLPQTEILDVSQTGETTLELEVPEPPMVRVTLRQNGETLRPVGQVEALIDGEVVFHFRTQDVVYVDPGAYVFRTSPNDFNTNMTVEAVVPESGVADVFFDVLPTLRTSLRFFAGPWDERIRGSIYYYQNGERVASTNGRNPVTLAMGTYDYTVFDRFAQIHGSIEITADTGDTVDITVPAAQLVVRYQTATGEPADDKRAFITSASTNDSGAIQSGTPTYLLPGVYTLEGWGGTYSDYEFEVVGGEDLVLVLRAQ